MRLGLSNVVVMYAATLMGGREAVLLNVLKAVFVLLTRGYVAGILSLSGGLLSICVILLLLGAFHEKASCIFISVCSATAHNIGQVLAISAIMGTWWWSYYAPFLLMFGVCLGIITGIVLKVLMPAVSARRWFR
jgi:heptaprenyl diphosphate synthase